MLQKSEVRKSEGKSQEAEVRRKPPGFASFRFETARECPALAAGGAEADLPRHAGQLDQHPLQVTQIHLLAHVRLRGLQIVDRLPERLPSGHQRSQPRVGDDLGLLEPGAEMQPCGGQPIRTRLTRFGAATIAVVIDQCSLGGQPAPLPIPLPDTETRELDASRIETRPFLSRSAAGSTNASTKNSGNTVSYRCTADSVAVTIVRPRPDSVRGMGNSRSSCSRTPAGPAPAEQRVPLLRLEVRADKVELRVDTVERTRDRSARRTGRRPRPCARPTVRAPDGHPGGTRGRCRGQASRRARSSGRRRTPDDCAGR